MSMSRHQSSLNTFPHRHLYLPEDPLPPTFPAKTAATDRFTYNLLIASSSLPQVDYFNCKDVDQDLSRKAPAAPDPPHSTWAHHASVEAAAKVPNYFSCDDGISTSLIADSWIEGLFMPQNRLRQPTTISLCENAANNSNTTSYMLPENRPTPIISLGIEQEQQSQSAHRVSYDNATAEGGERDGKIWGLKVEDYRALSARDRKRVRNRVSARAFRAKRKDLLSFLESDKLVKESQIQSKDEETLRLRTQIADLKRRLAKYEAVF